MDYSKLQKLQEENPNSTKIFEDNVIDTFYPKRPADLESVCLYDFVKDYEKIGIDDTGLPMYRKRSKALLPNHKLYDPNKENEREDYYYSILLLFIPFRDEHRLLDENETAEEAFQRYLQQSNQLNIHHSKLQQMLTAQSAVKKINEARCQEPEAALVETEGGP